MDGNEQVRETDCDLTTRPQSIKSCNLNPCPMGEPPLGSWITKNWEKVSIVLTQYYISEKNSFLINLFKFYHLSVAYGCCLLTRTRIFSVQSHVEVVGADV